MTFSAKPNEIRIQRLYDAPVQMVWDAWCDPEQVVQWWGPRGFTLTTHSKDLRVGGIWHYTMHGPDGTDYENKTLYFEVEPCAKLVYDHGGNDEREPLFRVTALFTDQGGKTLLDMTMALADAESAAATRKFVKKAGGEGTWDRLAEFLGKKFEGKDLFVIQRSFSVPQQEMYRVWTEPEHVARWLPPTGFTMEYLRADIRPGGSAFYRMTNGADVTMYGRAHYKELSAPTRLVYSQEFCDENENIARHPHAPTWPASMLTTVTLTAEAEEQTRVTIKWEPQGAVSDEEIAAFLAARPGMTLGWSGSFEKLEQFLGERSTTL